MGIIYKENNLYIVNTTFTLLSITVFKDFKSDGATIPKIIKPLFKEDEYKYLIPAILHDWMYANQMGYFKSNLYFYKAMKIYKVNKFIRFLFWLTVTLFGWIFYYKILYFGYRGEL